MFFFLPLLTLSLGWVLPIQGEADYPYSSGQAVFVQSPYSSSLYTSYPYHPYETAPQRLPSYTTNQAVFVQKPYATAQQTVASFPVSYANGTPSTDNRYTSPSAFPATVAPSYPFASSSPYVSAPYPTAGQGASYDYPYAAVDYTGTYLYPYTTATETDSYPPSFVEKGRSETPMNRSFYSPPNPQGYPTATYSAYPITTVQKYPYPATTTAVPEIIEQPTQPSKRGKSGTNR